MFTQEEGISSRMLKCGKCDFSTEGGALQLANHLKEAHYTVKNSSQNPCQTGPHVKAKHMVRTVEEAKHLNLFEYETLDSENTSNHAVDGENNKVNTQQVNTSNHVMDGENIEVNKPQDHNEKKYTCDKCGKAFQKAWVLLNHMACFHQIRYMENKEVLEQQDVIKNVRFTPAKIKNVLLNINSPPPMEHKEGLRQDDNVRTDPLGPLELFKTPGQRMEEGELVELATLYKKPKCSKCPYESNQSDDVLAHFNATHGNQYECELCSYKTPWMSDMKVHGQTVHENLSIKIIKRKNENVSYKPPRKVYRTSVETSERDEVVEVGPLAKEPKCPKFPYESDRSVDARTHYKAAEHEDHKYSYQCNHCSYRTHWTSNLKIHLQTEHDISLTRKANYKCDLCKFTSYHKASYKRHLEAMHQILWTGDEIKSDC